MQPKPNLPIKRKIRSNSFRLKSTVLKIISCDLNKRIVLGETFSYSSSNNSTVFGRSNL